MMTYKPKELDPNKIYRQYECKYYKVMAPTESCYFCKYLTDIFWDYTNGPYGFVCDINAKVQDGLIGECEHFEDEGE